ncbi:MAG TPA: sulfotransferase [Solirubrobacteraceae bacterium]|nr:sulfotransferase [Solirubrobacteraceae bacterium]
MQQRPKVVYVLGSGRSGSTIIGLALGNCARIVCAGELHLWLGKDGRSPLPGARRESFWASVREQVEVPDGFPRRGGALLEKSSGALDPRSRIAARRLRAAYGRIQEQLFAAVARTAGAEVVVDTSHFPRRARELQRLEEIDLFLLFVVRNPQKVVGSYSRDDRDFPRFGVLSTNAYLWLTYLLSLGAFLRHPRERRLLVRYEAFAEDPEGVLAEILERIGSDAAPPDLSALDTGVAFQGNSLLRKDSVAFERQPERPSPGSRLTALLNAPWALVFSRLGPAVGRRA